MPTVKLYVKKQLRLDRLTFEQRQMREIGEAGLVDVKRRIRDARNTEDQPSKRLKPGYAKRKQKRGLPGVRNLALSGKMLANLTLRTVSENKARAGLTSRKERAKGLANTQIEPFLLYSPANERAVLGKTQIEFGRSVRNVLR